VVTNPCCDGWGIEVEQAVPPAAAKYFRKIAMALDTKAFVTLQHYT
jgi:hypothetical protein